MPARQYVAYCDAQIAHIQVPIYLSTHATALQSGVRRRVKEGPGYNASETIYVKHIGAHCIDANTYLTPRVMTLQSGVWRRVEEGPGRRLCVEAGTLVPDFDRLGDF